ncbi:hypothetical protein J1N35_043726 [Gossypium stocksii]|uniref:hAT-like transposase RNase-H fold domain-containing protein n=1 Tax=Gossypium stocksii TaxID=47602 RepID=A0A9D3ZF82_9ROSI|nr:hypothetical protein J1N35_043726 [Gossypium stocksii]
MVRSQNSSPSRDDQTKTKENVRKKITPRAACWNHFTKFVTKEGEKRARGESIGQAIEKCLRDWGIERVFTITVDNASANSVAIEYLRKKLNHRNASVANENFIHMRCVAHILNLIVQYGIKDAFVSVDRVRGVVRYISASPSRLTKFNQWVKEEMIDSKAQLCLDVSIRWNSTDMMLKVAEKYERAFESYVCDDHNFFLDLTVGDEVPTFDDWEIVRRVIKVLEPFYHPTPKVSGSLHVTFHSLFEVLTDVHCLFDGWQDCGDLDIISMTSKMRDKYNKYWREGKKINMLVYLAVIFDSRCKMSFLDFGVNLLFPNANDIMKMIDKELHCLFNKYSSISQK